jgi:hypothetical protein
MYRALYNMIHCISVMLYLVFIIYALKMYPSADQHASYSIEYHILKQFMAFNQPTCKVTI